MIKVETIEQFKVLEFIKSNFEIDEIEIELVDKCTLKVKDNKGDSLYFTYKEGEINWHE